MPDHETQTRLLIRVAWELLKTETFESVADFSDRFKHRLGKLHIRWLPEELDAAITQIAAHSTLVGDPYRGLERVKGPELLPDSDYIPRGEASAIYQRLQRMFGTLAKRMPDTKKKERDIYGPGPYEDFGDHDRY